jgi:hypothetical protein
MSKDCERVKISARPLDRITFVWYKEVYDDLGGPDDARIDVIPDAGADGKPAVC